MNLLEEFSKVSLVEQSRGIAIGYLEISSLRMEMLEEVRLDSTQSTVKY